MGGIQAGYQLGNMVAPGIGGLIGSALGGGAGALLSAISGSGAYTIKENTLLRATPVPSFGPSCIRIKHREYLGEVVSSSVAGAFEIDSYAVNPGDNHTFPWLSGIAHNYEEYKFNGLVFEFVSTSANALNSTNTALGKIVLATDYNSTNPTFGSIEDMMITEFANFGKPAESLIHAIECSAAERPTLLSYLRLPGKTTGDAKFYDIGNFQVATQGLQGTNVNVGSLWVSYDVYLCKPYLSVVDTIITHYALNTVTTANPLGTSQTLVNSSPTDIVISGSTITFPKLKEGTIIRFYYACVGTLPILPNSVTHAVTNLASYAELRNSTANFYDTNGVISATYIKYLEFTVTLATINAALTYSSTNLPTAVSAGDLLISISS